jgi:hypothetical protein
MWGAYILNLQEKVKGNSKIPVIHNVYEGGNE